MPEYNDSNRAFLQAFMARSSMTFEDAQPILAAILTVSEGRTVDPDEIGADQFSDFISAANTAVSPFDLEIRSLLPQALESAQQDAPDTPPKRVYALVNTTSDPLTQLATTYSPDEIAFLKRLLDYMFTTNNNRLCEGMVATQMQAVQLHKVSSSERQSTGNDSTQTQTAAVQSLRMTQAETMIVHLIEEGWLQKSPKGYLSLTPRALMELRGWLVSTYNDESFDGRRVERIKSCAACKEIITVGQRCENRDCPGRLHDHCMRNFFRMQQAEKCPVCQKEWPGDKFVGERALSAHLRPSNATPRQRQSSSAAPSALSDNSEDENDDAE
ncbi:DNA repair protein Nse1, putative [Penicillium digitatum]|uniref:Non-structural maintenance of chromosomes element 1 homolog n=3 Tax=Penicillium digitatum TaxID=36651 RepID=K9G9X4_PEND2|nr:DNA repair protein Nse1, putative [Penicillium digitatum Pd1]EKV08604.1 DNA repair protein Nse1, putative [Penicillium digitatum Pd1]EKV10116.1 DNA repair protein Nse1, putative [Penicillium digitatum PHI26]QQK41826.1 DNA repair protein Nse1, putative [Penicillium digitatum]